MRAFKLVAGLVGLTCLLAGAASAQTTGSIAKTEKKGQQLSAGEVASIYNNRTWVWKDGAGYFGPENRRFTGWSGSGKAAAYGEGVWYLRGNGTICFRAMWTTERKTTTDYSCFEHRKVGNTIFARNTVKGNWYVLTGPKKQAYQEIKMMKAGDQVSKKIKEIKTSFERPATAG